MFIFVWFIYEYIYYYDFIMYDKNIVINVYLMYGNVLCKCYIDLKMFVIYESIIYFLF